MSTNQKNLVQGSESMGQTQENLNVTETTLPSSRNEILELMKTKIGYKVQVVPFNTVEWKSGIISGILDDERAKKPLWVIKLDNSNKVVRRAFGSELVNISDEKGELPLKKSRQSKDKFSLMEAIEQLKFATEKYLGYYCELNRNDQKSLKCTIVDVFLDKRTNSVIFKLSSKNDAKIYYWTYGPGLGTELVLSNDYDVLIHSSYSQKLEKYNNNFSKDYVKQYLEYEIEKLKRQIKEKEQLLAELEA